MEEYLGESIAEWDQGHVRQYGGGLEDRAASDCHTRHTGREIGCCQVPDGKCSVVQSDHDSEYTRLSRVLAMLGIPRFVNERGQDSKLLCNASAESVFGQLKREVIVLRYRFRARKKLH